MQTKKKKVSKKKELKKNSIKIQTRTKKPHTNSKQETQTITNQDLSMSENTLQTPIEMSKPMLCYMPMLLPGLEGMPLFDGTNATEFLEQYNNICKEHFVDS